MHYILSMSGQLKNKDKCLKKEDHEEVDDLRVRNLKNQKNVLLYDNG